MPLLRVGSSGRGRRAGKGTRRPAGEGEASLLVLPPAVPTPGAGAEPLGRGEAMEGAVAWRVVIVAGEPGGAKRETVPATAGAEMKEK